MNSILWYVLAGTRGGPNRARIVHAVEDRPRNATQLAEELDIEDEIVRDHLTVLTDNDILASSDDDYGAHYLPSTVAENNHELIERISETH